MRLDPEYEKWLHRRLDDLDRDIGRLIEAEHEINRAIRDLGSRVDAVEKIKATAFTLAAGALMTIGGIIWWASSISMKLDQVGKDQATDQAALHEDIKGVKGDLKELAKEFHDHAARAAEGKAAQAK